MSSGERIFITGASAGIGRAYAERVAAPGVTLGLAARREALLAEVKAAVEARGATAFAYAVDVADGAGMAAAVDDFAERAGGLTMAVANAGISTAGRISKPGAAEAMAQVIRVNVVGVIHTLAPAVPHLIAGGGGRLVTVGSVAGFRGLPGRADYNASKAAVKTLMDGLRLELREHGIAVISICPGFIDTALNPRGNRRRPFLMPVERAADLMARAIRSNRKTYVFPWQWRVLLPLIVRLPDWAVPRLRKAG